MTKIGRITRNAAFTLLFLFVVASSGRAAFGGPGGTAQGLVCPVAQDINTLLPINPVTDVACALSAGDIQYITVYKQPGGGTLTRETNGIIETPTLISATHSGLGTLLPDLVGTTAALSLSHFRITIDRFPTAAAAPLPISVDVLVNDPTNSLPRHRIHLGYDATSSHAPNHFQADITLGKDGADPHVDIVSTVTPHAAGDNLTVSGGLFNGGAFTRTDPLGGSLAYAPMPTSSSLGLTVGSKLAVHLTTNAPTTLHATANLVDGNSSQLATAVIAPLPSSVGFTLIQPGPNQRTVNYTSSTPAPLLDVAYRQYTGTTETLGAVLNATGVPTNVQVVQTGARTASVSTNGAFGSLEVGFADGEPILSPNAGDYVLIHDFPTQHSYAARLAGLQQASIDASSTINVDAQFTPAGQVPVALAVYDPSQTITGTVGNLPAHLTLLADLGHPSVIYNGHGQGLNDIVIDGSNPSGFFDRATSIHVHASGIPSYADLSIDDVLWPPTCPPHALLCQSSIGKQISSTKFVLIDGHSIVEPAPIGLVEFMAGNGPLTPVPGTNDGAVYVNTTPTFQLSARAHGFSSVLESRVPKNSAAPAGGEFHLAGALASGPFDVYFTDDTLHATANIANIPSRVDLRMNPIVPAGTTNSSGIDLQYVADAPIGQLTLEATSTTPFVTLTNPVKFLTAPLTANHIKAILYGVQPTFHVIFNHPDGAPFIASIDNPVDHIDFWLDDGVNTLDIPHTAANGSLLHDQNLSGNLDSGIAYHQVAGQTGFFAVAGRVYGLKLVRFDNGAQQSPAGPLVIEVQTAGGHIFDVNATLDQSIDQENVPLNVLAEIADLPSDVTATITQLNATIPPPPNSDLPPTTLGKTTIDYQASSTIGRVEALLTGPQMVGRAHAVYGEALGLPTHVNIVAYPFFDQFTVTTDGNPITKVNFQAVNDASKLGVEFPTISGNPGASQLSGASPDADGLVLHDFVNSDGSTTDPDGSNPTEFTLAAQVSGLRGAFLDWANQEREFKIDVVTPTPHPFGIDMETQSLVMWSPDGILNNQPTASPVSLLTGFIDSLQPNTDLRFIDPTVDVTGQGIFFTADNRISQVEVDESEKPGGGNIPSVVGPKFHLDVSNLPTTLDVCVASNNNSPGNAGGDSSGCLRGRPPSPPAPAAYPPDSGPYDGSHLFTANIDDEGTAGTSPMTVNDFYLCLLPYPVNVLGTGGDCRKGSLSDPSIINHDTGALSYLSVTNATLFNVMADLFVKQVNAADIPPLMSGHVAVDTRNQELTGDIVWYDQPFPVGQDLWIAVHFPKGFRANYRYTNWTSQSVFDGGPAGGSYDNEYGTVDCPAGTSIKAHIDLVGGGTFSNDEVAQNFLCHIKGRTSPWYPNG